LTGCGQAEVGVRHGESDKDASSNVATVLGDVFIEQDARLDIA
jgi:hypothetical protein